MSFIEALEKVSESVEADYIFFNDEAVSVFRKGEAGYKEVSEYFDARLRALLAD